MKQQFQLAYFGRVDYADSQDMPVYERKMLFDLLIEQKEEESKRQKQLQNKKSKSK